MWAASGRMRFCGFVHFGECKSDLILVDSFVDPRQACACDEGDAELGEIQELSLELFRCHSGVKVSELPGSKRLTGIMIIRKDQANHGE